MQSAVVQKDIDSQTNIDSFIPYFPDITDKHLQSKIFKKAEFYENKLENVEPAPQPGGHLASQKIVKNLLSSVSSIHKLLLFHQPGSGKTCASSLAAENIFNEAIGINKALVLVKNDDLAKTFMSEVWSTCASSYKKDIEIDETLPPHVVKRLFEKQAFQNVSKKYIPRTHDSFANELEKLSDEVITKKYSNLVIIFDEVQNILNSAQYKLYHKFLHLVENCIIIILTGTPMMNSTVDAARLMNLILEKNEQLITEGVHTEYYAEGGGGYRAMKKAFSGRISCLTTKTDIKTIFAGEPVAGLNTFNVALSTMSEFQSGVYREQKSDAYELKKQEASLFVYPDGNIGSEGYKNYFKAKGGSVKILPEEKGIAVTEEEKEKKLLTEIGKYSCKYATIIKDILANPNHNQFVYLPSITGGGAILFGRLLRYFGYREANGNESTEEKRYAILSDETNLNRVNRIIDLSNKKENSSSQYIHVLIGGKKIVEGFTFKNIRRVHFAMPHWNCAIMQQALARCIRMGSHRDLEGGSSVTVFFHMAVANEIKLEENIDYNIYKTAERKELSIKTVVKLAYSCAVDCGLMYKRNYMSKEDNAESKDGRNPFTQFVDFECADSSKKHLLPREIELKDRDFSTYNLVKLDSEKIHAIGSKIKQLFSNSFKNSITEIYDKLKVDSHALFSVMNTILYFIENRIPIANKYYSNAYLQMDMNGMCYLTDDLFSTNVTDHYYCRYPILKNELTHQALDLKLVESVRDEKDNNEKYKIVESFPLSIKSTFIEEFYKIKDVKRGDAYIVPERVFWESKLNKYIIRRTLGKKNKIFHSVRFDSRNNQPIFVEFKGDIKYENDEPIFGKGDWIYDENVPNSVDSNSIMNSFLSGNKYGIYGIKYQDEFMIVNNQTFVEKLSKLKTPFKLIDDLSEKSTNKLFEFVFDKKIYKNADPDLYDTLDKKKSFVNGAIKVRAQKGQKCGSFSIDGLIKMGAILDCIPWLGGFTYVDGTLFRGGDAIDTPFQKAVDFNKLVGDNKKNKLCAAIFKKLEAEKLIIYSCVSIL
jgi:hypothetical protein